MRRRLFTAASVLSLLLCAAVLVLWVRSHWRSTYICYDYTVPPNGNNCQYYIAFDPGIIALGHHIGSAAPPDGANPFRFYDHRVEPPRNDVVGAMTEDENGFLGARYWVIDGGRAYRYRNARIPFWMVAVACAAMPVRSLLIWLLRVRQVHRGLCPACSYNLTGNTSGACPECGTAVAKGATP